MSVLEGLLEQAQSRASAKDGSNSPIAGRDHRGMGAVSLLYNPYECKWLAKADWSDSSVVKTDLFDSPVEAVSALSQALD